MVDDRETKQRYRADHLVCAAAHVKRKNGEVQELGLLAVLDGDTAVDDFVKRADKLARKSGGGEVVPPERSVLVPYTKLSPEMQAKVLGPEATQPGTLTEPRAFNLMF